MKLLLSSFILLLSFIANSGTLVDNANLLGPEAQRVREVVNNASPVWIETHVSLAEPLNHRADGLAMSGWSSTKTNAFAIVITTNPRAWRISMYPQGCVSSEFTRQVGDAMAAKFKQGKFADGLILAAQKLSTPNTASFSWGEWWPIITCGAIGLLIVGIIIWLCRPARRVDQQIKEQRENIRRTLRPPEKAKADRVFNRMSRNEREVFIESHRDHPYYRQGLLDDPVGFYLFMDAIQGNNHCHHSPISSAFSSPSASSSAGWSAVPGQWPAPPSVSDSFGSSGSYDSGSSSSFSDSGSSFSDSSGSSGNW